jgi:ATP/maltotriose-dependent transcriptional regulator MalT
MPERTPEESLAEAVRIHDDDPWAARELMLPLAGRLAAPGDLARLAWLATHVLGGLLKRWPEALQVCRQAVAAAGTPRADLLRSLAASATLAGDVLEAAEAEAALAALLDAAAADCAALTRLLVIEQDLTEDKLARWLPLLDGAVARAEAIGGPPDLVRLVAITTNNSASAILDWLPAASGEAARVVERTARLSFRCWLAVGSWVQHERAHYLMALVLNATGQPAAAADHARQGLALIAANEPAPIDACFHLLALARASQALGDAAGADRALAEAATYPAGFDEYWRGEYEKIRNAL